MSKLFIGFIALSVFILGGVRENIFVSTPSIPNTATAQNISTATPVEFIDSILGETTSTIEYPTKIIIPSIKLDAPIQKVGVNEKGEMDVPSGQTNNVGWYQYGTLPGKVGSAVLDAHVYAAFANLRYVKIGDSIQVETENGKNLRFEVIDSRVYALNEAPAEMIFHKNDGTYLNLITCARRYIPALDTYSHRLVVFAKLVGEVEDTKLS